MSIVGARRSEFAELMPNHVFGYENRNKLFPVVHGEGISNKLRNNSRSPRPGLDYLFGTGSPFKINFAKEALFDIRPFFDRSSHSGLLYVSTKSFFPAYNKAIGTLIDAGLVSLGGHTPGGNRMTSTGTLTLTTTMGMIYRVHGYTT
jgi:hypothetical protein